jgi:hypothetical protein
MLLFTKKSIKLMFMATEKGEGSESSEDYREDSLNQYELTSTSPTVENLYQLNG